MTNKQYYIDIHDTIYYIIYKDVYYYNVSHHSWILCACDGDEDYINALDFVHITELKAEQYLFVELI